MTLYKVGDFYEIKGKDAEDASEVLDLIITVKKPLNEKVIGFPIRTADFYIKKLLNKGFSVNFDKSCSNNESAFTLKEAPFSSRQLSLF